MQLVATPEHVVEDSFWVRMIDGRANYFHLLFIEPHLHRAHAGRVAAAVAEETLSPFAAHRYAQPTPLHRAVVSALLAEPAGSLADAVARPWHAANARPGLPLLVVGDRDGQRAGTDAEHADLERAMAALRAAGLSYFVDLAVGAVVVGEPGAVTSAEVAVVGGPAVPGAAGLLGVAARCFAAQWLDVETRARGDEPDVAAFADAVDLFASSVVHELLRRDAIGVDARGAAPGAGAPHEYAASWAGLLDRELQLEACAAALAERNPLCVELLRCWYPCHPRWTSLFGSPFDYLAAL
ncbi:MAG TPA: hypothetical protein VFQ85_15650 [Mycobacteriales bacterium]|nr:hypothetical protein [Mycobacteriales bacterium]